MKSPEYIKKAFMMETDVAKVDCEVEITKAVK